MKSGPPRRPNEVVLDGEVVRIRVDSRKYGTQWILVDAANYARVKDRRWYAHRNYRTFYATACDGANPKLMHHALVPYKKVDHRNGNGLDNRQVNLRPVTTVQNGGNRKKELQRKGCATSSQWKGVTLHKQSGRWMVRVQVDGKRRTVGLFEDELEAARAYNIAAVEAFGEYAHLNQLEE
jgi:hypothetical protein